MYYTYMLRCEDNSIYTGIAVDIKKRMSEHFSGNSKCAKYTLRHKPVKLECFWTSGSRSLASKLEYRIKTLTKEQKEELIEKNNLSDLLGDKIDCKDYFRNNEEVL